MAQHGEGRVASFFRRRTRPPRPSMDYGTSNGISYRSSLETNECYGRYACCVERKLLDVRGTSFASSPFRVGGLQWILRLNHTQDGNLSGLLSLESAPVKQPRIEIHASFEVVNEEMHRSIHNGFTTGFSKNEQWGAHLSSTILLTDPHGGFLTGRYFTIVLELRICIPENEWQAFSETSETKKAITWKLKNLNDSAPWVLQSRSHKVGNHEWQIQLYPRGDGDGGGGDASLYVFSPSLADFDWRVTLTAENETSPENSISNVTLRRIEGRGLVCGTSRFIPAKALGEDAFGFLKDGYFTTKVEFVHVPRVEAATTQQQQDRRILPPASNAAGVSRNGMIHVLADQQSTYCMHCRRQIRTPLNDDDLVCICLPVARPW